MAQSVARRAAGRWPRAAGKPAVAAIAPPYRNARRRFESPSEASGLAGADWRGLIGVLAILAVYWTSVWLVGQTNIFVCFSPRSSSGNWRSIRRARCCNETAHRLVFRGRRAKLAFDLLLEMIMTSFGKQLTYQHEHVSSHHPHLGNYERDYEHEDLCRFLARRAYRAKHPRLQPWLTVAELIVQGLPLGFLVSNDIFAPFYERHSGIAAKDPPSAMSAPPSRRAAKCACSSQCRSRPMCFSSWRSAGWAGSIMSGACHCSSANAGVTNLGQSLAEHPGDDALAPHPFHLFGAQSHPVQTPAITTSTTPSPLWAWTRLPKLKKLAPETFGPGTAQSYVGFWWSHVRDDFQPFATHPAAR